MNLAERDYPIDTGQSLAIWLDQWAVMEKARIARQQQVKLNQEGWHYGTIEQWARILAPDERVAECIERLKEAKHAKTKGEPSRT